SMIRPLFTEIALFLIPFVVYAVFLVATSKGVLDPASWPLSRLAWLFIAALAMMIGSFVGLAQFGGATSASMRCSLRATARSTITSVGLPISRPAAFVSSA